MFSESEQFLVKHIIKNTYYLSLERARVYETVLPVFKAIKQSHKAVLSVVAKLTNCPVLLLLLLFFIFLKILYNSLNSMVTSAGETSLIEPFFVLHRFLKLNVRVSTVYTGVLLYLQNY